MILCDTSIWVRYFRRSKDSRVQAFITLLLNDQVCINEFIYAEILQGIRDDKQFNGVKTLLDSLIILPHKGMDTVNKAIQVYRTCNKKTQRLTKTIDAFIAVTAIEHRLELFHFDKEFDVIAEYYPLKIYNWLT